MKSRRSAAGRARLYELGEDRLLEELLPALRHRENAIVLGPGDDCAIVRPLPQSCLLLLKTDCVVEGIHFTRATPPSRVGWKAMARSLSDFAAMSGIPRFALITLIVPATREVDWVKKVYRELKRAADRFGVRIVGGETSSIKGPAVISVSIIGMVEKKRWVGRDGGKAGDDLFVTGRLGGSIRHRHLNFVPRIEEARWLTENFSIHAMMDLSDGLGADLPRLAQASGVGFDLDTQAIPKNRGCTIQQALTDGEDYELLFALRRADGARLQKQWRKMFPKLLLTRIGKLKTRTRRTNSKLPHGYVHFE